MPIKVRAGIVASGLLAALALGGPSRAQGLGGYGAGSASMGDSRMGASGSLVIPFAGMYRGFMPSRMAGGSSIRLSSRSVDAPSMPRKALSLGGSEMTGGSAISSMGMKGDRVLLPSSFGPRLGPASMKAGGPSMGVTPPNLGSPFRPPTILSAPAAGPGMSM